MSKSVENFLDCGFNAETLEKVFKVSRGRKVCDACLFLMKEYQYHVDF
jgi:hypothetical protein